VIICCTSLTIRKLFDGHFENALIWESRLVTSRPLHPLQDFPCGPYVWLWLTGWTNFNSGYRTQNIFQLICDPYKLCGPSHRYCRCRSLRGPEHSTAWYLFTNLPTINIKRNNLWLKGHSLERRSWQQQQQLAIPVHVVNSKNFDEIHLQFFLSYRSYCIIIIIIIINRHSQPVSI